MPSSLTSTKIKDTYRQVLHVDGGVTTTPKTVYDGDGTATALKVSTTGAVVETSSSTDALRITQTGAGNALVVEDSANPDSTPFVIDAAGLVLVGDTTARNALGYTGTQIQSNIGAGTWSNMSLNQWSGTSTVGPTLLFNVSKGGIGVQTSVSANNSLGWLRFSGSDGTNFVEGASIQAAVDGTPGTNDMPGRLVFSTTADGASSPTERMRINSMGNTLFGRAYTGSERIGIGGGTSTLTATTSANGIYNDTTVSSAQTASYVANSTYIGTQAAAFTLSNLLHNKAAQGAIGAASAVTNQYGYYSDASLTGATNNYGFYSNIASGTGRFNFYAAGSAGNFFAGNIGVGIFPSTINLDISGTGNRTLRVWDQDTTGSTTASISATWGASGGSTGINMSAGNGVTYLFSTAASDPLTFGTANIERMRIDSAGRVGIAVAPGTAGLTIGRAITGGTSAASVVSSATASSDVTFQALGFQTFLSTQATAYTLSNLRHYYSQQGTIGAGSTVTNQYGFGVDGSLTGATNNYGFYSGIAAGTGRYNFYAAGSADNYFAGSVGIGESTIPRTQTALRINGAILTATDLYPVDQQTTVPATATTGFTAYRSVVNTAAAAFTLPTIQHFAAIQTTLGAGSTVTNQYGYVAGGSLTGATNNFGFSSNIASGTGRWNFYAAGSADNYFAGNVGIGATPGVPMDVVANSGAIAYRVRGRASDNVGDIQFTDNTAGSAYVNLRSPAANTLSILTGGTERMRIDSSGNLIHAAPTTPPTLATNGTMVFNLTSNTNLRVSVRGSDGVTRVANITLA